MVKWTYPLSAQKQQNEELDKLKIFKKPKGYLYHYTSREVFWKIMDSETLLARHTMFSNDYEENKIGTKKIQAAMEKCEMNAGKIETQPFMICFCAEDDLLSQWRGYAKEGVSLEFDFSKGLYSLNGGFSTYGCYTIMNNDTVEEEYLSRTISREKGKKKENDLFMGAVKSPYSVIYTESKMEEGEDDDLIIEQQIQKIEAAPDETRRSHIVEMIPYIKNKKFAEEKEYRLIFDMNVLVSESNRSLLQEKYTYLDEDGVRKPNIRVKFGDMSERENEITRLYYVNSDLDDAMNSLTQELEKDGIKIEIVKHSKKFKMPENEVLVSNSKYQEEICTKLRMKLHQRPTGTPEINVWCDGHLPIRKVTVAPSKDAELMKCSIQEYLKTKYWARDIKVEISKIPLRI